MISLLIRNGAVTVGRMGSFLHSQTQNHSLSRRFKQNYGGLKKFCAKYSGIFILVNDHQFNPTLILSDWTKPDAKLDPQIISSLRLLMSSHQNDSLLKNNNYAPGGFSIFPRKGSLSNLDSLLHDTKKGSGLAEAD